MNCPVCFSDLRAVDRQGVEIDFCPRCKGVWLDRGELDKLLTRVERSGEVRRYDDDESDLGERRAPERRELYPTPRDVHPPKKREGFLSRIFDFD